MNVAYGLGSLSSKGPVVTMGFFDGVHAGHSHLLRSTSERSIALERPSLTITLWPHPRHVLQPSASPLEHLSSLNEKVQLISSCGIDELLILKFTPELAATPAQRFVQDVLVGNIGMRHIVVGHNHVFGHRGEGNLQLLRELAPKGGYTTEAIGPVLVQGQEVRSSLIRDLLQKGEIPMANRLLTRPYYIEGRVEAGTRLGRTLGFPTANIAPLFPHKLTPAHGVYAVWATLRGITYPAMLNIGVRPTVTDQNKPSIEAHIIGFSRNAYCESIHITFIERMRNEIKFPNIEVLKAQLATDREKALSILSRWEQV